jgi:hypothetical protein
MWAYEENVCEKGFEGFYKRFEENVLFCLRRDSNPLRIHVVAD